MHPRNRCPACGSKRARFEYPADYHYFHCGLTGVHLFGQGVVLTDCPDCHESTTTILGEMQLLQAIGLALVLGDPGLTGEQLRYVRKILEMTQDELASAIGKGRRETVAEWEAREQAPVFRTPYEELGLRAILMALFEARVIASEYCCLSTKHVAEFRRGAEGFVARAGRIAEERTEARALRIRRRRDGDWLAGMTAPA